MQMQTFRRRCRHSVRHTTATKYTYTMPLFFKSIVVNFLLTLLAICQLFGNEDFNQNFQNKISTAIARNTSEPNTISKFEQAISQFWQIFESASYDQIDEIIIQLKALYLEDPNSFDITLLIAHAHFWKVAERFRLKGSVSPNITDNLIIAETYFTEAQKLNPKDARIDGWLSGVRMALANIHDNPDESREAYFYGEKAIRKYPSFNHFSIVYLFSNFPHTHRLYNKAIKSFYKSMDLATHSKVDRGQFDYTPYLSIEANETDPLLIRAVWNGPKARHNLEGFFLIMGDFLVKSGQTDKALIAYNNAKAIPSYQDWSFKNLLEKRIVNIEKNVSLFRKNSERLSLKENRNIIHLESFNPNEHMVFNSYNCTICHKE